MKDYSLCEDENGSYITHVKYNGNNNTYTIYYADGTKFKNVEFSEANLNKIKRAQEKQADRGVEDLEIFKGRKSKTGVMAVISGIGTATLAGCFCTSPLLNNVTTEHPVITIIGIGVLSVIGTIPAFSKFKNYKGVVEEIEKVKYRNEHREILDSFLDYPNALTGVTHSTASSLLSDGDPFSILKIDGYTKEDLETIVNNIEKEKMYNFDYPKTYRKINKD